MSSKLLWFLIGSAATLVGATVAAKFMDDEAKTNDEPISDEDISKFQEFLKVARDGTDIFMRKRFPEGGEINPSEDIPSTPENDLEVEQ